MLVGARLGAWSGWKNPYITDGLIAMWDGEWNVGGGIHDENTDRWVNIVGDDYFTDATDIKGSWAPKGISLSNTTTNTGIYMAVSRISEKKDVKLIPYLTLEACGGCVKVAASDQVYWPSFANMMNDRMRIVASVYNNVAFVCSSFNDGTRRIRRSSVTKGVFSTSLISPNMTDSTTGSPRAYIDGTEIQLPIPYYSSSSRTGASFAIGQVVYAKEMTVHCVRLYSRTLSADEIAHNYEIDKARFGIA